MKFNKFKVLHLGHGNPIERIPVEKDLGIPVHKQLYMIQLCAHSPAGKVHLRLHKKRCGQQVKRGNSGPLFSSCETQPGTFCFSISSMSFFFFYLSSTSNSLFM